MRILVCCNAYPPNFIGGAELIAHYQAKCLAAGGHEVHIFTGDTKPGQQRHAMRTEIYDGLKVHRVHLVGADYQSEFVNFVHPAVERHFERILREFSPDVVHCHNIIGLSVGILRIAHEAGKKVVLTLHDHWGFCFKNTAIRADGSACALYSQCEQCQQFIDDGDNRRIPLRLRNDYIELAMNAVDVFISPSKYLADTYIEAGFSSRKMHVLWNGIDVQKFGAVRRIPSGEQLRFSFLGYFGWHKGIHTLLAALPMLRGREQVQINLIGEGDQRAAYEQQLIENKCSELVRFWGKLDNNLVHTAYAQTDVLVLPSVWRENQPVSITEAMACGIPVIASNIGGMPELVRDGFNGYTFEAGDPRDLAEKMDRLIFNRQLVSEFGENGRVLMRNNSFTQQVKKLQALYVNDVSRGTQLPSVEARDVIACVGRHVHHTCAKAIELLPEYLFGAQPRLLMSEWLTEAQLRDADLIWVVDEAVSLKEITGFSNCKIPLLVPARARLLVEVCREFRCGLYFDDAHDAAACISHLLARSAPSRALDQNIQSAVERWASL